ncbi:MAG: hypothetical protein IJG24_05040, partial [Selenomonadaceae bacterium]|nr:hypothetical protein [Selenomonadaceae bacterium]
MISLLAILYRQLPLRAVEKVSRIIFLPIKDIQRVKLLKPRLVVFNGRRFLFVHVKQTIAQNFVGDLAAAI